MFQNPKALYLMFFLPVITFLLIFDLISNKKNAKKIAGKNIEIILPYYSFGQKILKVIFYSLAFILTIFAVARPRWGVETIESELKGSDIFILLDVSNSMACEDVVPSRFECSKINIMELLETENADRYGLMIFSDENMLLTPLTYDYASIYYFLESLSPGCLGNGGTNIGYALNNVLKYYDDGSSGKKAVLLITDGENLQGDIKGYINRLKDQDIIIFTAGIGTESGKLIPVKNENGEDIDFIKDENGNAVRSSLDEKTLLNISKTTGGSYLGVINKKGSLVKVINKLKNISKSPKDNISLKQQIERFDVFLIPALILFCLGFILDQGKIFKLEDHLNKFFKKSKVALLLFFIFLNFNQTINADNNQDEKSNKPSFYNNPNGGFWGNISFKKGNFKKALQQYKTAVKALKDENLAKLYYNMGNVYYFLNDFKNAQVYYERSAAITKKEDLLAKIFYNHGLTSFKNQNYEEAAQLFKKSLKYNDQDDDARYNYTICSLLKNESQKQKDENDNKKEEENNVKKDKKAEQNIKNNVKLSEEEINKILRAIDEKLKEENQNKFNNKKGNSRMKSW